MALNTAGLCSLLLSGKLKNGDLNEWGFFFFPLEEALLSVLAHFFFQKFLFYSSGSDFFLFHFPQFKNGDNLFSIIKKNTGTTFSSTRISQASLGTELHAG